MRPRGRARKRVSQRAGVRISRFGLALAVLLSLSASAVRPGPLGAQSVERRVEAMPTGAVTTILPDETAFGAKDVLEMLQGRVPGLVVSYTDEGELQVRVRSNCAVFLSAGGASNPLLIVDGVPISSMFFESEIKSLNPFRVERIDVVRDQASLSMYGNKASCGIIQVFTKRRL